MKIKQSVKRKLALFLSCLLMMQTLFTGGGVSAATGEDQGGNGYTYDIKDKTEGAFDTLAIRVGEKVENNSLFLAIDGSLKDAFLQNGYYNFLDNYDGLDPDDWNGDKQGYESYEAYLNAQDAEKLPEIKFFVNFTLDMGSLDIGTLMSGDMIVQDSKEVVGHYTLTQKEAGNAATLTGTMSPMIYYRTDVRFGQNIWASLEGIYKPEAGVEVKSGTDGNDFVVTIPEAGLDNPGEGLYELTKKSEVNKDDLSITYTISAKSTIPPELLAATDSEATDSEATGSEATDSEATGSEADKTGKSRKKNKNKKNKPRIASDSQADSGDYDDDDNDKGMDPEDDANWEDDEDSVSRGPGLFGFLDSLISDGRMASPYETKLADLTGLKITDKIPEGLTVIKVEARETVTGDGEYKDLTKGTDYTEGEDGTLSYIISGTDIHSADLRITTQLSDELYNQYMLSGEEGKWNFTNKAMLKGEEDKLLAISPSVSDELSLGDPYIKDGKALNATNREFEWRLNVTSKFSNWGVTLYAVDHIVDVGNTHNYKPNGKIVINGPPYLGEENPPTQDIVEKPIEFITDIQSADSYAYDKITNIGMVQELLTNAEIDSATNKSPIAYKYISGETDGEPIYDAIMLIPLSDYKNQDVTIDYRTVASAGPNSLTKPYEKDMKNDAKILWKWPVGHGPGLGSEEDFGGAGIDKKIPVDYSLVKKTTGGYNETDNTITWNFEINQFGVEIGGGATDFLRIEDVLTDNNQALVDPDLTSHPPLKLIPYGTDGIPDSNYTVDLPYQAGDNKNSNYYTIVKDEGAGTTKLIVHFTKLLTTEHYRLSIKTMVTDKNLGSSGTQVSIRNSAAIKGQIGTTPIEFITDASQNVTNTLILKKMVPFDAEGKNNYNYVDNIVKWEITINPRSLGITAPVIEDTLPEGTHFAALTGASYDGTSMVPSCEGESNWSDTAPPAGVWTVTNADNVTVTVKQVEKGAPLTFTFSSVSGQPVVINKPFKFEFTNYVEKEKRLTFKSNGKETLTNTAVFKGRLGESAVEFNASDIAVNEFDPAPMKKDGTYIKEKEMTINESKSIVSAVDWTLYVNRTKADMVGATITDEIRDCMELIPETMKVYTVTLDEAGKETDTATPVTIEENDFAPLAYNRFVYKIPERLKNETLKFTFTTVMVDEAYASDICNSVSISGTGLNDKTDDKIAENADSFHLSSYAHAAGPYYAKINKTSTNQDGRFPLKGAKFEIHEANYKGSGDKTDVTNWEANGTALKARVSNKRGGANFMFLKANTMYIIKETEAPLGYVLNEGFKWYVVLKPMDPSQFPLAVLPTAEKGYGVYVSGTDENNCIFTIENVPLGGENVGRLSFIKKGHNGQLLPGVKFTLKATNLKAKTAISMENGEVIFDPVDRIDASKMYTISETETPVGYKKMKDMYAKVYQNGDNGVVSEIIDADEVAPDGVVTNEPITQSGSFKKVDQNGGTLADVVFNVVRRGDGGDILGSGGNDESKKPICIDVDGDSRVPVDEKNTYKQYFPTPTLRSDANGVVKISNFLYGDYKLTETPPSGIQPGDNNLATVYLKVNAEGMFASTEQIMGDNTGTKLSETDGTSFSVTNKMQYGMIQVNKVVGEKNGNILEVETHTVDAQDKKIPLSDIEFKIFKNVDGAQTIDTADRAQEVMMLKTNEFGNFTIDSTTGEYTMTNNKKKRLLVGKYFLEEQESALYKPTKTVFPFEIKKQDSAIFTPTTIYVDSEATNNNVNATVGNLFLNEPRRGQMSLKKVDTDYENTTLTGAEFKVWTASTGGNYVAKLVETANGSKRYVLKGDETPTTGCTERDAVGKLYLKGTDTDIDGRSILYGDYWLEEVTAPEHYVKPTARIKVTVMRPVITTIDTAGNSIKNKIIEKPVKIKKLVEQRKKDPDDASNTIFGSYIDGASDDDQKFEFTLGTDATHKGPVNMPTDRTFTARIVATGSDGVVTFSNVPIGSYILTETKIPEKYGKIVEGEPAKAYIELMKPVVVTVTDEGVSYAYVDGVDGSEVIATTQPETGKRGTEYITVTEDDVLLTTCNNYKLGSANGIKMAIATGMSTVTATVLAGAEFTLTNKETQLEIKATSNEDGLLSFTNVPYGTYILTETGAPLGYKPVTKEITIASDTVNLGEVGNNYIDNELILSSLKFAKVDQNGDTLTSTKAKVTFEIESTQVDYTWPAGYKPPVTAENDETGVVSLRQLAYGTYTIKEKAADGNSNLENETISFTIKVGPESATGKTKITITPPADAELTEEITLEAPNLDGIYDFTTKFKLKNRLKHGDVRIQKTLANEGQNGEITSTNTLLAGIEFEIYRKDGDAPESTSFATLVTDETGDFKKHENGKYVDKDGKIQPELVVGDYYLKEIFPPDSLYQQFSPGSAMIPFTIIDSTPSPHMVTEFTYDGNTVKAENVEKTAAQGAFYNIPVRQKLSVEKKDADAAWTTALKGAEFTVSLDESGAEKVARLTDADLDGIYDLSDFLSGEPLKKGEVPYLHGGLLLPGTYYVKETKAPAGYILPSEQAREVIIGDKDVLNVEITNKLDQVTAQFSKADQNGNPVGSGADGKTKVTFTVERLNSSESETELDERAKVLLGSNPTVSNDEFGIVKVGNLITGTYKLTEQELNWASGEAVLYITVAQSGIEGNAPTVTISKELDLGTAASKVTIVGSLREEGIPMYDFTKNPNLYQVKNDLCYAFVDITKVSATANNDGTLNPLATPLPGVQFNIYEDLDGDKTFDSDTESAPYLQMVTDDDGHFKKDALNQYLDVDGTPQTNRMVYGRSYLLREEKLPDNLKEHFQPDPNYYPISIPSTDVADGTAITYYMGTIKDTNVKVPEDIELVKPKAGDTVRFPNGPLGRGEVSLIKTDADNPDKLVKGAEFDIYATQEGGQGVKAGELADDGTGTYSLKIGTGYDLNNQAGQPWIKEVGDTSDKKLKLLTGKYYLKETTAPGGYILPKDAPENYWYFTIAENGVLIENDALKDKEGDIKAFTNSIWKREVVVQKQVEGLIKGEFHNAGENDDTFTFELVGTPSNATSWGPETATVGGAVGEDKATFKEVPSGTYTLTEIMTDPSDRGGVLSDVYRMNSPISVIVDESGVKYAGSTVAATQTLVKNELKRGSIEGKKMTEDLTGKIALAGATFRLTATDPNTGDTRTAKSDSGGRIFFPDIPLGKYKLEEIKAPDDYEISDAVLTVTVSQEGQTVKLADDGSGTQADIEFMNHAIGSLTIEKRAQVIEGGNISGVMRPGQDFVFKITGTGVGGNRIENILTDADITGAKQIVFQKDGKESDGIYVTTGPEGKVILNEMPVGNYQVQEQENEKNGATGEYVRDVQVKPANITINHKDGKVTQPTITVENRLKRAEIKGLKTQGDKITPLAGAVIGLFPGATVEFTEANLLFGKKMTTGEDGIFRFTDLPCGTYLIAELEAPAGYYLNNTTKIEVTVSSEGIITTGYLIEGTLPKAEQATPIIIANTKRPSGGGGGGGGGGLPPVDPNKPGTGPGAPTEPETQPGGPTEPGTPTLPNVPTVPVVPDPGGGNIVEIPPEIPPGSNIVVTDPNGDTVYEGTTGEDGNLHVDLPPGDYILTSIDENGIPLAQMVFTIEDEAAPLAMMAPDAGDHAVPIAVLAIILLGALAGVAVVLKKRRDLDSEDKQTK